MRPAPLAPAALLAVTALLATPLAAQNVPALYDLAAPGPEVTVRAAPSGDAEALGAFGSDITLVEVVALSAEGDWGQVNLGEGSGWVEMAALELRGVHIDNYNLPDSLFCMGTEPFWSVSNINGALHYDTPDMPGADLAIWIAQDSGIAEDLRRMVQFAGIGGPGVAFLYPAQCSDGMSDRAYGLAISLMTAPGAPLLSGCCTLNR